jgi:hypothetical protein
VAGAATPPGRAVAAGGGYRITGRWAWASGIHQAKWVSANCLVFDGDQPRKSADGAPVALGFVFPKEACKVLDTWHVGGMRGTGSTEFELANFYVPADLAVRFFSGESRHPYPIFRPPPTFFGFNNVLLIGFHDSSTATLPVSLQTGQCMIVSPSIAIPGESPMHAGQTPGGSSSPSSTGSR